MLGLRKKVTVPFNVPLYVSNDAHIQKGHLRRQPPGVPVDLNSVLIYDRCEVWLGRLLNPSTRLIFDIGTPR